VRPLIVLTLIVLLPCLIVGQTDKKAQKTAARTVEEELERLDDEVNEAAKRGDASFFEKFLADDYTGVGATGHTSTKAGTVDFVRSGKLKIGVWKISDRKIRIFGDMAVITQEEQYTDSYSGATDISGAYRVTLVFGKTENGQWQELVWQSTKEQGSQRH
jgi:hypothetical protein